MTNNERSNSNMSTNASGNKELAKTMKESIDVPIPKKRRQLLIKQSNNNTDIAF